MSELKQGELHFKTSNKMEIVTTRGENLRIVPDIPEVLIKLNGAESEIVNLATVTPYNLKVKEADPLTLAMKVSSTVNARLGYNARKDEEEDAFLMIIEADIKKFPDLTENEIMKALDMGIDGHFVSEKDKDKDVFFNSAKFVRWIHAYIAKFRSQAMSKYLQLQHQIIAPEPIPADDDLKRLAIENANIYADKRTIDKHHRVHGASGLYINLERFGIYEMPLEEKIELKEAMVKLYPQMSAENIKAECQSEAYNRFIQELVDWQLIVTPEGKVVELLPDTSQQSENL